MEMIDGVLVDERDWRKRKKLAFYIFLNFDFRLQRLICQVVSMKVRRSKTDECKNAPSQ